MALKKSNPKSRFRKIIEWLHLWLGLSSGIIVFIVCLTGTLFVFHDEVNNWRNREVLTVPYNDGMVKLSPDSILKNLAVQYPRVSASFYSAYADPVKPVKIMCMNRNIKKKYFGLGMAFADPYTGKILKVDHTYGVFRWLGAVHMNLLLDETGTQIVKIATVIFFLELITGFIWWLPRRWNRSNRKKSFTIMWKARWKRLNVDLHNVLGFYALPLAIVLAFTGLVLSYDAVRKGTFRLFGGDGAQTVYQQLPKADSTQKQLPLAFIFRKYEAQLSGYPIISCSAPSPRRGYYQLQGNYDKSMITNRGKTFYVDAYTGSTLNLSPRILKDARMANTNLSLHIGTWYGLPGKILTFIVCLICTSLPVTGFMIWLNKRKKIKNRRRPGCPNLPAFKAKSF